MPPLKTYEFKLIEDDKFFIKIYAYSEKGAIRKLSNQVKDISKFEYN